MSHSAQPVPNQAILVHRTGDRQTGYPALRSACAHSAQSGTDSAALSALHLYTRECRSPVLFACPLSPASSHGDESQARIAAMCEAPAHEGLNTPALAPLPAPTGVFGRL